MKGGKPLSAENMSGPFEGATDGVGGGKEAGVVSRGPIGFVKDSVDGLVDEVAPERDRFEEPVPVDGVVRHGASLKDPPAGVVSLLIRS